MGIIKPGDDRGTDAAGIMVGMVDFRLRWPSPDICYLAMVMVAEPFQRQGIGSQAWQLLHAWLAGIADIRYVRGGVEQQNLSALAFFQRLGFRLTGESRRMRVREKYVRILFIQRAVARDEPGIEAFSTRTTPDRLS
jgi:ribosomal protein S18 acetylase RimI-like enzyme